MQIPRQILDWLSQREAILSHRQLVVISGSHAWSVDATSALIAHSQPDSLCWFGDSASQTTTPIAQYRRKLGSEFDWVVFDCFDGMRANALIATSGLVAKQGLMILLCPDLAQWPGYQDPQVSERVTYGFEQQFTRSRFIQRLVTMLKADPGVCIWTKQTLRTGLTPASVQIEKLNDPHCCTLDQKAAVAEILTQMQQPAANVVLTADRGRGKSAALGIAAARLYREHGYRIVVTAAHKSMTDTLFKHAQQACPELVEPEGMDKLIFMPFDQLLSSKPLADVILVDEAAAIPNAVLEAITKQYQRIVFSTTVQGYEGSGRGFALRFLPYLQDLPRSLHSLTLKRPIRWYSKDTLEQFWFSAMAMHESTLSLPSIETSTSASVDYQRLDRDSLINHTAAQLDALFQLLVAAHYRTTPDDLMRMLDAPDQAIHVLHNRQGELLAVAVTAIEGTEKLARLAEPIASGLRRVKGHLSAQKLGFEYCQPALCRYSYLRVVRIAVNPHYRQQGFGSMLLTTLKQQAEQANVDFLSASFGLTTELLSFWRNNQFIVVNVGNKKDASSGEYSALVLHPLAKPKQPITSDLSQLCRQQLLYRQHLGSELTQQLEQHFEAQDRQPIDLFKPFSFYPGGVRILAEFVAARRPLNGVMWLIAAYLQRVRLDTQQQHTARVFLQDLCIEKCPAQYLAEKYQLTGKRQIEHFAREQLNILMIAQQDTP